MHKNNLFFEAARVSIYAVLLDACFTKHTPGVFPRVCIFNPAQHSVHFYMRRFIRASNPSKRLY